MGQVRKELQFKSRQRECKASVGSSWQLGGTAEPLPAHIPLCCSAQPSGEEQAVNLAFSSPDHTDPEQPSDGGTAA